MAFGKDNHALIVCKSIPEIKDILSKNIFKRAPTAREKTDKLFIGVLENNGFSMIESSPIGVICKLNGGFQFVTPEQTIVDIETSIQRPFIVLFLIWIIVIAPAIIIIPHLAKSKSPFSLSAFLLFIVAGLLFRLFLHILYMLSRNKAINRMEDLMTQH